MPFHSIIIDERNTQKFADNDLSVDDVANAVKLAYDYDTSRSTGAPILFGPALDGREVAVVYEEIDEFQMRPTTAFYTHLE